MGHRRSIVRIGGTRTNRRPSYPPRRKAVPVSQTNESAKAVLIPILMAPKSPWCTWTPDELAC